jgi:hypothetical protein
MSKYILVKKSAECRWHSSTHAAQAGLPDGIFSYQKSQFWYIFEELATEDDSIFCEHLVYFTAI